MVYCVRNDRFCINTQQGRLLPFKFNSMSERFTLAQLRGLKTGRAAGFDNIPPRLLKYSADIVAKPLTRIINASISQGLVPTECKAARVLPLFKKSKNDDMDNYRPISTLPV